MAIDVETIMGVMGNVLEWYDFAVYGYFGDVIAKVFFPPASDSTGLIWSYAVFGGAFLMRPIGGVIMGATGDIQGRKKAVVLSMIMMAVPTFVMGCLPSYEKVGWISTLLLVLCRLLQGLSVGGQLPSCLAFTVERQSTEHWGYYGAFAIFASGIGVLLGNIVGAIIRTVLNDEQLVLWGWRIPFLGGVVIGFVAVILQIYGTEINPNEDFYSSEVSAHSDPLVPSNTVREQQPKHPITESFKRENLRPLIASILAPMLAGANYYVTFIWMAVYMEEIVDPPVKGAFWINALTSFFGYSVPLVYMGWLSDKYGRIKIMMIGTVGTGMVAPLMLWVISMGRSVPAFFAQFTIGVISSLNAGPLSAWLCENFPPQVRLTGGALGYNLGVCISSGFSPLLATALVHQFGPVAPGVIYPLFALLTAAGLMIGEKKKCRGVETGSVPRSAFV